ncbi:MAG: c-type cytochrome [Verrucomicrobia bacterium]|nr:c-type cytochrome [Verrucomicrobiota bacterium]
MPPPRRLALAAALFAFSILAAAAPDGKQLYATHCAACHGDDGNGDGLAAAYVTPKPRDFTKGLFKIRSTPSGEMPTDEDLFQIITHGMPGSAMTGVPFLSGEERRALVAAVKDFIKNKPAGTPKPIAVGPEPPASPATLAEGKQIYALMQCAKCHGEGGKGDGPSAKDLRDSAGDPIKVRDFTNGVYLGGPADRDLYLRFTTGLDGTPMPSYADSLTDAQRWALVHYVQSLRSPRREEFVAPADGQLRAARADGPLTTDPAAKAWDKAADFRVPLTALWPSPHPLVGVHVRALHDGNKFALRLEWEADSPVRPGVKPEDLADAAALQFSVKGTAPFIGMGDEKNPANIWFWKLARQADTTAKKPAVSDMNATGAGPVEDQPPAQQNVTGRGGWSGGKWRVVFLRDVQSKDANDVPFAAGASAPVAFAVWTRAPDEKDALKSISTWYRLALEK